MGLRVARKSLPFMVIISVLALTAAGAASWMHAREALHAFIVACSRMWYVMGDILSVRAAALGVIAGLAAAGALYALYGFLRDQIITRRRERAARGQAALRYEQSVPVYYVRGPDTQAWTAGLLRPRVYLSRTLCDALSAEEAHALLAHELSHARHRDVLKRTGMEAARRAFFFIPTFREIANAFKLGQEVRADRDAMTAAGRRALCGLYLRVSGASHAPAAAGFAFRSERLSEVLDGGSGWAALSRLRLAVSVLAAMLLIIFGFIGLPARAEHTSQAETSCEAIETRASSRLTPLVGPIELYTPAAPVCSGPAAC